MRIFRLVLAVLTCSQLVLVGLFFLALDGILLVDRREQQIDGFANKGLTGCGRRGDTGEETQGLDLAVEVLEADAGGKRTEDR